MKEHKMKLSAKYAMSAGQDIDSVAIVKSGLSDTLFRAACMFAKKTSEIEAAEKHISWPQPGNKENMSYSVATVIMAAAAVEAAINEIYDRAVDKRYSEFPKQEPAQVDDIASKWSMHDRDSIIEKHNIVLDIAGRPRLLVGEEPAQSAVTLFKLRNLIMHYKPEWSNQLKEHKKLQERLKAKFVTNQLNENSGGRMLWFPGKCLGAGCAKWACDTAYNYHVAFVERLGAKSHLKQPD